MGKGSQCGACSNFALLDPQEGILWVPDSGLAYRKPSVAALWVSPYRPHSSFTLKVPHHSFLWATHNSLAHRKSI